MTDETQQEQDFSQVTINDVFEKKIEFTSLPKDHRTRLIEEYRESLPTPEDRFLAKEFGYSPEGMHGGKDRDGNAIKIKPWEEFKQDIIHKAKSSSSSEIRSLREQNATIQRQMEEMAALVKMQVNGNLQSEEEILANRIQQARDDLDFTAYDQLIAKKFELEQRKSQVITTPQKDKPEYVLTLAEREAMEDFRYINKDFLGIVSNDTQVYKTFDDSIKLVSKSRPELSPKEVLAAAKKSTEDLHSTIFKPTNNVYMNNQYNSTPTNNFIQKKEEPKIVYDNLSPSDQRWVNGALRNYPGKTHQQVAEQLFASVLNKK